MQRTKFWTFLDWVKSQHRKVQSLSAHNCKESFLNSSEIPALTPTFQRSFLEKKREVSMRMQFSVLRCSWEENKRLVECRSVGKASAHAFLIRNKAQSPRNLAQVAQFISHWKTVSDGSALDRSDNKDVIFFSSSISIRQRSVMS